MAYKKAIFMVVFLISWGFGQRHSGHEFQCRSIHGLRAKTEFLPKRLDKPTSQAKIPPISGKQTTPQPRQAKRDRPGL
jgi:hypothetical protein